ncbi:MAG: ABC transporter ATP-binding protein [Asgard group archaeon]|nr:ABC transporter ATP-binding protein [Asgard group archaeon]
MITIEFRSVNFSYEKRKQNVLNDISLNISQGELVAIVGKNGAGKTTLLKHINGLLRPLSGEVWIDGENIKKKKLSEMAQVVGLAFQNPNHQLFAETVEKELAFGPRNLGYELEKREELVQKIAEKFNITHLLDRNPLDLSGGERRIVSIASVLTMNQKILALDEPSFGQDYKQKRILGNFLHELAANGITVVIISHDLDFILEFFPRVIVLNEGRIIADNKTIEILSDLKLLNETDLISPITLSLLNKLTEHYTDFPKSFDDQIIVEKLVDKFKAHEFGVITK